MLGASVQGYFALIIQGADPSLSYYLHLPFLMVPNQLPLSSWSFKMAALSLGRLSFPQVLPILPPACVSTFFVLAFVYCFASGISSTPFPDQKLL